jgi:hypothetical protein
LDKSLQKQPLERLKIEKDNIKMDLRKTGFEEGRQMEIP